MATTTQSAAHSLLALVNDVLDIAKIEAGRFTLDEEPFDLHEQLGNLRRMLHLEAQGRGLYLRLRVDPTHSDRVHRRSRSAASDSRQPDRQCDQVHAARAAC